MLKGRELNIEDIYAGYLPLKDNAEEFVTLHDESRKEALQMIMDFIIAAMEAGFYFTTGNCDWCDYGPICGRGIKLVSQWKMEGAFKDKRIQALAEAFKRLEAI